MPSYPHRYADRASIEGIPASIAPKDGTPAAKLLDMFVNPSNKIGGAVIVLGAVARMLGAPYIGYGLMSSGAWIIGENLWDDYEEETKQPDSTPTTTVSRKEL